MIYYWISEANWAFFKASIKEAERTAEMSGSFDKDDKVEVPSKKRGFCVINDLISD